MGTKTASIKYNKRAMLHNPKNFGHLAATTASNPIYEGPLT